MKNILRYILGYIIGAAIFAVLIPWAVIKISQFDPFYIPAGTEMLPLRIVIALPFFTIGVVFILWSNFSLLTIGKGGPTDGFNVAISPRTKKLVISGPYRYTRNPMVFGALSLYWSIGLFQLSLLALPCLLIFFLFIVQYLKRTEEQRLVKDFGGEFIAYKNTVPMIFPFRRKQSK
jgi:protein-S-isoprenylcysteine O-methyltransferase Ste14